MISYFAKRALLPSGWANNVRFEVQNGMISCVEKNTVTSSSCTLLNGPVLPTLVNLHSHSFQRLMAGMTEVVSHPKDSFWSWREHMYAIVSSLSPEELEVIASFLYIELLKGGYSQVGEFHYVHKQASGENYPNPTCLGEALIKAANNSGIGLTLLPALYQYSGFGKQKPNAGQTRFVQTTQEYLHQHQQYNELLANHAKHNLGLCFHSLRATDFDAMHEILDKSAPNLPVHIHIAEQQQEVEDCLAFSGKRPIQWLLDNCDVNDNWTLIHATHASASEVKAMAKSGAVVGLCPTTEANLGDGLFPVVEFENAGGIWGIGSDSHISTTLQEELRWLEYGQRLQRQKRNCLHSGAHKHVGNHMYNMALKGGCQSTKLALGLAVGRRADFMVLSEHSPFIASSLNKDLLNRYLFGLSENPISDVYVAGDKWIDNGAHPHEQEINQAFLGVLKKHFSSAT